MGRGKRCSREGHMGNFNCLGNFFLPKYYGEHGCLIMYIQVAPNSWYID